MDMIHPAARIAAGAFVAPGARIAEGCVIGPFCSIGPEVVLEAGVELVSHVVVDGRTTLGQGVKVLPFATIGLPPQDLKYKGEPTGVVIGARTQVREHATIHRGSVGGDGLTRIGADCLIMCVAHIAHDCVLEDRVILANNVMLGGHVRIGDTVFVGGGTAIHQFVRIGRQAVLGGMSGIEGDVIPYGSAMGNRARLIGLNLIGLKRRGFTRPEIHGLRGAFRTLFKGEGSVFGERVAAAEVAYGTHAPVVEVLAFLRADSRRGLMRAGRMTEADDDSEP
jgi:UDP-N-acetylglucosamine acyltransferase